MKITNFDAVPIIRTTEPKKKNQKKKRGYPTEGLAASHSALEFS
jgi:hypothetical protein